MTIEVRIVPMERYQVTRRGANGVETVAENLTYAQAQNIAGAVQARAESAGKKVQPIQGLSTANVVQVILNGFGYTVPANSDGTPRESFLPKGTTNVSTAEDIGRGIYEYITE